MVDKKALKEMGKKALKAGKEVLPYFVKVPLAIGEFILSPLMLPTYIRRHEKFSDSGGALIIVYWGIPTLFGNGVSIFAGFASDSKYFLYPATFISANVLSGIYEWYLDESKKYMPSSTPFSGSSPASSSSSRLEEKVEKEEKKADIKNLPNPWDIDIPTIEDKKVGRNY